MQKSKRPKKREGWRACLEAVCGGGAEACNPFEEEPSPENATRDSRRHECEHRHDSHRVVREVDDTPRDSMKDCIYC
jgi:hypothetical protein